MAEIEVLLDFGRPYVRLDDYNEMKERYWSQVTKTQDADGEAAKWQEHARAALARAEAAEARVAELESQLAAQQWRPVTEKPEKPGWYSVYDSDGHVFYNADIFPYRVARWTGKWDSAFNGLIDYWCPLPPAPQETE